jgi:transposase InsO family protein
VSRQAYYQRLEREIQVQLEEEIILQLVHKIRRRQPMIGGRKLLYLLRPDLEKLGHGIGRDRFFDLLREYELLIERRKKYQRTTDSNHPFYKYPNLIKGLEISRVNQAFVADITYLDTLEGFIYLFLLTDMYSRRIMGHEISEGLGSASSIKALQLVPFPGQLIHHSDRGIQYCNYAYTDILRTQGTQISMAAKGNPYENAMAERVNGILKIEFLLDQVFPTKREGKAVAIESIEIYNNERPHLSLNYQTPEQVYQKNLALQ